MTEKGLVALSGRHIAALRQSVTHWLQCLSRHSIQHYTWRCSAETHLPHMSGTACSQYTKAGCRHVRVHCLLTRVCLLSRHGRQRQAWAGAPFKTSVICSRFLGALPMLAACTELAHLSCLLHGNYCTEVQSECINCWAAKGI